MIALQASHGRELRQRKPDPEGSDLYILAIVSL